MSRKRNKFDNKGNKKRRNRGRNKDGALISLIGSVSSLTIFTLNLFAHSGEYSSIFGFYTSVLLALIGVYGYYMQSCNRMTRNAQVGLVLSIVALVGNVVLIAF